MVFTLRQKRNSFHYFFVEELKTLTSFFLGDARLFTSQGITKKVMCMREHAFVTKKPRFQVSASKETNLCRDVLVKKHVKHETSGMERGS